MTTINLGLIAIVWQGVYNPATTYVKNQAVSYNGNSYIALQTSLGQTPAAGAYWGIMSQGSNVMTTIGDIQYQDTAGVTRLPIGTPGQQLLVNSLTKPSWGIPDSYTGVSAVTPVSPLVANPSHTNTWMRTPWLISAANSYFADCGLPNPACGPIRRSQARSVSLTFWAWLNTNREIVARGGDNAFHFMGAKSAGDTQGSRILSNISNKYGGMLTNDYFVSIHAAGSALLALTAQGDVFAVGSGVQGLLGMGDTLDKYMLTRIPFIGPSSTMNSLPCTIVALHVGQGSGQTPDAIGLGAVSGKTVHAIDINGRVWAWGTNNFGQLGLGNTTTVISTPTLIAGGNSGFITSNFAVKVTQISGSGTHTILVDSNNQGYVAGHNTNGQLGINTVTDVIGNATFQSVAALSNLYQVEAVQNLTGLSLDGGSDTYALQLSGTLLVAGLNANGQLGTGNTTQAQVFQTVTGSYSSIYITGNSGASNCVAALGGTPVAPNQTIWTWGGNVNGQCGIGSNVTPQLSPVQPSASSQYTAATSYAVNGTLNTTAAAYPRTGIAAILPSYSMASLGGGFWTLDTSNNLWYFGTGDGMDIVDNTVSVATTSNTLAQKFPAPFNTLDGWIGQTANTLVDWGYTGSAIAAVGANVMQVSNGRQFSIGGNANKRFQDDGFFSGQFREVCA